MTEQLAEWTGEFGRAYTDRNQVDWHTRVPAFKAIVPSDVVKVLEVGTNAGHNLQALASLGFKVYGTEPADYARLKAVKAGFPVCHCSVYELADAHREMDLVLTSGVLIHVPPERLDEALSNIYWASSRYVLAIEYAADQDEAVVYRGHQEMLWKRNYGAHYQRLFPELELVDVGELSEADGFDRDTFWLLKK